ncbi:MAG: type IV toxin-antitoxin system AbiEi family antitoxin domain-containing protein [Smithellaceae bacterium]|nr:type IV toxin-antitoxin system AbiEi family antitoxin domain-containing protein [Smithellaceae bacterium]
MSPTIEKSDTAAIRRARVLLHPQKGAFRTGEAVRAGVHTRTIYTMRDKGVIERLGRGMYRFADMPTLGNPDLATVAMKVPKGVICLISALSYHEMTTEIPHEIYLALPRGAEPSRLDYPPLRIFWFSGTAFTEGIEQHDVDGIPVRVYNPEKTLADCFKYRNKIGLDVVLEALKFYRQRKRFQADDLMRYARICRVERVMRPYLEATL